MMPSSTGTHKPSRRVTGRHFAPDDQSWRQGKTTAQQGYGSRWQAARIAHLRHHPVCAECRRQGVAKAASVVDHIVPHRGNQALFWDRTNWQSLCRQCHSIKTASEDGGFGNRRQHGGMAQGGGE